MTEQERAAQLLEDYIKQLGGSLSILQARERQEIIQEVQGHLQDRLERCDTLEDFQQTLQEFGPPDEYARRFVETYRASQASDSASLWQILQQGLRVIGHRFSVALSLLMLSFLYLLSISLVLVGLLKPLFPESVGLWLSWNPFSFRFGMGLQPVTTPEVLGYWIIPLSILLGVGLFIVTNRLSRLQPVAVSKKQARRIRNLSVALLLLALAVSLFAATSVKVISGEGNRYVLEANKTRLGILILDEGASAILMEDSNWIGLIVSADGQLMVEDRVTIIGPIYLFSDSLRLGANATLRGSAYLFAGRLTLEPGASLRRDAILFAGDLELGHGANSRDDVILFAGDLELGDSATVRDDAILFAGDVVLDDRATLGGDTLLFAGDAQIGREAVAGSDLLLFAGDLELTEGGLLRDDAVLFAGGLHLRPESLVEGDVVLTAGDATLDDNSVIAGRLLLNQEPGQGRVYQASSARVDGGISYPNNINSITGWRTTALFLKLLLKRLLPLALAILVLVLLVRFRRRRRARALELSTVQP